MLELILPKASDEAICRRRQICAGCEQMQFSSIVGTHTCGTFLMPVKGKSCGCILSEKTALRWSKCPQKKWTRENKK